MEKMFQSAEDFEERLNKGVFTNLEKTYNSEQVQKEFGDCQIIEKSTVDGFIQEVYRHTGGEIMKGRFNDTSETEAIIEKAKQELSGLVRVSFKDEGGTRDVFICKSKADGDTFSKGKEAAAIENSNPFIQKLEKGKIYEAFRYSELLKFTKTGKEIIEKMSAQVAVVSANITRLEQEISAGMIEGNPPTEPMYQYGLSAAILCPYLLYHYCLEDYWEGRNINEPFTNSVGGQIYPSSSTEEATPFRDYNRLVHSWFEEQKELQLIRLCESNFKDSDKYELTAEQMIALGF